MKLIILRQFCRKMHTHKSLLINAFKNSKFIMYLKINIIILPYLGKMSQIVKTRLTKTMNKHMKFCKLRVIFQTNNRLRNYFRFKDFVPETLRSSLIYQISCRSCTASHIGKTYRHFKVRVSEHQGVSQEQVSQLKVPYQPLLGITCLFVTIK